MLFTFLQSEDYTDERNELVREYIELDNRIEELGGLIGDVMDKPVGCGSPFEPEVCDWMYSRLCDARIVFAIEFINVMCFHPENICIRHNFDTNQIKTNPVRHIANYAAAIDAEICKLVGSVSSCGDRRHIGILVLGYNKTTRAIIARAIPDDSTVADRLYNTFNLKIAYDKDTDIFYNSDYHECAIQPVFTGRIILDDEDVSIIEVELVKEALCDVVYTTHPESAPSCKVGLLSGNTTYPNNRALVKLCVERTDLIDVPTGFAISEVAVTTKTTGKKPTTITSMTLPSLTDCSKYTLKWEPKGEQCDVHITLSPAVHNIFSKDYPIGMLYNEEDATVSIFLFFNSLITTSYIPYREKLNESDFWLIARPALMYGCFPNETTASVHVRRIPIRHVAWISEEKTKLIYGIELRFNADNLSDLINSEYIHQFNDRRLVYSIETAVGALQFIKRGCDNLSRLAINQMRNVKVFNSTAQIISFMSGCNSNATDKTSPTIPEILEGCSISYPIDDDDCCCGYKRDETLTMDEYQHQPFDVLFPQTESIFGDGPTMNNKKHCGCHFRFREDLRERYGVEYHINDRKLYDTEVYLYDRNAGSNHEMIASVEKIIPFGILPLTSQRPDTSDRYTSGLVVDMFENDLSKNNTIRFVFPRGVVFVIDRDFSRKSVNSKFFIDYDTRNGLPVRRGYRTENGTGGLPGNDKLKEFTIPLNDPTWACRTASMTVSHSMTIICQLDILGRPGLSIDFRPLVKDIEIVCELPDGNELLVNPDTVTCRSFSIPAFRNPSVSGLPTTTAKYLFHLEVNPQSMPIGSSPRVIILRIAENDTTVSIEKFPLNGVGIGNGSDVMRGYLNCQNIEFPI